MDEELIEIYEYEEDLLEGIRPAFGSPGGKRFLAKTICSYIPEHKTYVEPFVGGGAVFFKKKPSEVEVLNDKDSEIAFAYRFIKAGKFDGLGKFKTEGDRNYFENLEKLKTSSDLERFHKFLYTLHFSYGKGRKNFAPSLTKQDSTKSLTPRIEHLPKVCERLKKTKIFNQDFRDVIKKYDAKETFFYFDPPYIEQQEMLETDISIDDLKKNLKKIKGKWILSLPKKSRSFELAKEYFYKNVKIVRTLNNQEENRHEDSELLISNFPLQKSTAWLAESVLQEFKLDGYDPTKITNDQLRDDWRLLTAKFSTMLDKEKTEFDTMEDLLAFARRLMQEILNRGYKIMKFHPAEMKPRSLELLRLTLSGLITQRIFLTNLEVKQIQAGEKEIVKNKQYIVGNFQILNDGNRSYGFLRLEEGIQKDKQWIYQVSDFIPFEKSIEDKAPKGAGLFWMGSLVKISEALEFKVEDYEAEKIAKLSDTNLIELHGKLHRIFKERGEKEGDELVLNAHTFILAELKKRSLEHRPIELLDKLTIYGHSPSKDKPKESETVKLEDVRKFWGTDFYLKDLFLAGVGGTFVNGEGNDLDIWVNWNNPFIQENNCPYCSRLLQQLRFRLGSFLPDKLAEKIHIVPEPEGKFTNYMPLARLKVEFIKPEDREILKMSLSEQKAASKAVMKMAEDSEKEDKIKLFRYFLPQKPTRAAKPNHRMTLDFYISLFKDEDFPVYSSKKYDGMAIEIHTDGKQVKIWSEDGEDITERLPETVEAVKKLELENAILLAELEKWEQRTHQPREVVSGYIHAKGEPDDSELVSNIFTCVYYNGKDLHNETEEVRQDILQKLGISLSTWDIPDLKLKLNKVPNLVSKNRKELLENAKIVSNKIASEGDVGKKANSKFLLGGDAKEGWIKFHKNAVLFGEVIKRNTTKVETVFNYTYGINKGKYNIKEKEQTDNLIIVGESFNTDVKLNKGDMLAIEFETFNFVEDERDDTISVSAWAPRFIPLDKVEIKVPEKIDDINSVKAKAKADGVLQEKVITPKGITLYESEYIEIPKDLLQELELEKDKPEASLILEEKRPLKQYPQNYAILVSHFRGKSVHLDFRRKQNGFLEGETVLNQPEGLITEEVDTIEKGKKWNDILLKKGKFRPDMDPNEKVVLVPKAQQPLDWLNVREVKYPPGSVGSTRFEWGTFITMDEGMVFQGTQKPYFKEFFFDMKHFKGRMVERVIGIGEEWEKPPKGAKVQWQGWINLVDQTPYLLTRRGRTRREDVPPDNVSWLPPEWEAKIKPEFQWWKGMLSKVQKLTMMDKAYNDLIERDILKGKLLEVYTVILSKCPKCDFIFDSSLESEISMGAVRCPKCQNIITQADDLKETKGKFILRWHWWMGAKVIRGMPARESHWDLVIDTGKDYLDEWNIWGNPLTEEKTTATRKVCNIKTPKGETNEKWLDFEGSIPAKDSKLKEVEVIKEIEPRIYLVKDKQGNEIQTKETYAKFESGQTAWLDQWENLFTGKSGGSIYGNINERIPAYMQIVDSGTLEWIEDSKDFASFKFDGQKIKGLWTMKTEAPGSEIWIFQKGTLPGEELKENWNLTSGTIINLTSVQVGETIEIKYKDKTYLVIPTFQEKLRMDRRKD